MCIHLPPSARVLQLAFDHRVVGVPIRAVSWRLPEYQQVFRHTNAHLGAVLALLCPPEPVGLVVLADNIGDDGLHSHVSESCLTEVVDTVGMERIDHLKTEPGHASRNDAVLD